jgi:hypothetical protein
MFDFALRIKNKGLMKEATQQRFNSVALHD